MFKADEQAGEQGVSVQHQAEPQREPTQPEPQQRPRPLVTCQGSPYRPTSPDDHDEARTEAGEHVGDYTDDGDKDVDYEHDGEYSNYGEDDEDQDCPDDDELERPARKGEGGSGDTAPAEQEPIRIDWLMKMLRKTDRRTLVFRKVREIVDNGDQAMVLGQIMYWFDHGPNGKPRAGTLKKGKRWLYKSHAEFSVELGIPQRRIRTCIGNLKDKGLIEVACFRANGQRTSHFRLNVTAVYDAMLKTRNKRRENAGATVSVARCD